MPIILAGVSHHQTPLEVRERLYFPESAMREGLDRLSRYNGLEERLILSTCNRVEVYSTAEDFEQGVTAIYEFLVQNRDIRPEELNCHLYIRRDADAMRHLFRVASSLDSMVVGEPQILGQVKDAFRIASEMGHVGKVLTSLFSRAFRVAKRVREKTSIGQSPVSVSSVAVGLAKKIFGSLENRTVLLLGAGEMGELAARHLADNGARTILVANRTFSRALELASKLGGHAVNFENLPTEMGKVDIIIASTGAPHPVVRKEAVSTALEVRRDAPIFLIDIAVPRDVDPRVNDLENVYLYDIDDLQAVVSANMEGREMEAQRAISIVEEELSAFLKRREATELSRTFASIRIQAEAFRAGEVEKTLSRLSGLGGKEKKAIEAMSRAIVNKLLHQPFTVIREMADRELDEESLEFFQRLFGIEARPGDEEPPDEGLPEDPPSG